MNVEIDKIRQISWFLAKEVPDLYFTKFLKLVYYLDFISVQEVGASVTGDKYFALHYGPVPSFTKEQVDLLDAETREKEVGLLPDPSFGANEYEGVKSILDGYITLEKDSGTKLKSVDDANDENILSQYEKDLLKNLADTFMDTSVKEIVEKTHAEPPYRQTPLNGSIDYRMAFQLKINEIIPGRNFQFNPEISFSRFIS